MHHNETFQQLKGLSFVIIIPVLTKLINILLIIEYIKSNSYHRTWQRKPYTLTCKRFSVTLEIILAEANTFLENNKVINVIFNYIFGLTFQNPFSKVNFNNKSFQ